VLSRRLSPRFAASLALGLGAAAALPALLAWGFTHPPRTRHRRTPRSWRIAYERVRLRTDDGLRLSAWYVPAPGGTPPRGIVVGCHGYFGNRANLLPHLRFLHAGGYAVLLFDFRAHGWSGGNLVTLGRTEQLDLRAALDWVSSRPDLAALPLAVLGESMGASVALLVASCDERVRAVVADSAFARLDGAVAARLRLAFGPPGDWLAPPTRRHGERFIGARCLEIAPVEAVARIAPRPVLLLHGAEDRLVTPDNARQLLAAAPGNAALLEIPGARHVRGIYVAPDEYAARVLRFLDTVLATTEPTTE
jgi:alpha-beta hydrolase superfamily lysophospholipase